MSTEESAVSENWRRECFGAQMRTSEDARRFIDFFEKLKGKNIEVDAVYLTQLTPRNTTNIHLSIIVRDLEARAKEK